LNERIKQLWSEAAESNFGDSWEEQTAFMSKFAELIVRECAQACINMGNDYEIKSAGQYQAELFAFAIKKHFGVEE
jgi:hypothetical protein